MEGVEAVDYSLLKVQDSVLQSLIQGVMVAYPVLHKVLLLVRHSVLQTLWVASVVAVLLVLKYFGLHRLLLEYYRHPTL